MNSGPPSEISSLRNSGTSLHHQLFLMLRDEIARGEYAASGVLPKEETLCERFGVSRITVRRALADLASEGLVERRHGVGTFVRPRSSRIPAAPTLGFVESLRRIAVSTEVQVLDVSRGTPPPDIANALNLPHGVEGVRAVRLRKLKQLPVMLTEAWVPLALGKSVSAIALRKKPMYEILLAGGTKMGRVIQEISAQIAGPNSALALKVEIGSPLIKLVRLMHDSRAAPVLHLTALLPPDRSRILMDIPGNKVNTLDAGQIVHDPFVPPVSGG